MADDQNFQVGDIVICVNNDDTYLKQFKEYKISGFIRSDLLVLSEDIGQAAWFKSRFKKKETDEKLTGKLTVSFKYEYLPKILSADVLKPNDKVDYTGKEEKYGGMHGKIGKKGTYENDAGHNVADVIWQGPGKYHKDFQSTLPVKDLKKQAIISDVVKAS